MASSVLIVRAATMPHEIFDTMPEWLLFVALAVLMSLGLEAGFHLGKRRQPDDNTRSQAWTLEAAFLGLVALLLGFTFSMTVSRYQARRELVISEADAIGTANLRLDVMPADQRDEMRVLMRRYVDVRLHFGSVADHAAIQAAHQESGRLQGKIWSRAAAFAVSSPTPTSALLLQGLNDAFDRAGDRMAEFVERVPTLVLLMLVVACFVGCVWVGLGHGFGRSRSRETWIALALLLAGIIVVLVDLDRPRTGMIKVSQFPMQSLQDSMER